MVGLYKEETKSNEIALATQLPVPSKQKGPWRDQVLAAPSLGHCCPGLKVLTFPSLPTLVSVVFQEQTGFQTLPNHPIHLATTPPSWSSGLTEHTCLSPFLSVNQLADLGEDPTAQTNTSFYANDFICFNPC